MPSKYVPAEGPKDAKIVIVGQNPGYEEAANGRPFIGPSGRLLDGLLKSAGIARSSCYLTNVIKEFPEGAGADGNIGHFFQSYQKAKPAALPHLDFLRQELAELNPNVIVPVGAYALNATTAFTSIKQARGRVIEANNGCKAIPIIHPASMLRGNWTATHVARFDMLKVAREAQFPEINRPQRTLIIDPPADQLFQEIFPRLRKAAHLRLILRLTKFPPPRQFTEGHLLESPWLTHLSIVSASPSATLHLESISTPRMNSPEW